MKCRRGARVRALWAVAPGTTTSASAVRARAAEVLDELPASDVDGFLSEIDSVLSLVPEGSAHA